MAIYQTITESFKKELFEGVHDFSTDAIQIALYTSSASIDASTTTYTTAGETSGAGYVAGGAVLVVVGVFLSNGVAFVDFENVSWPGSNFSCRGALIYNSSKANKSIAVLDFGSDKTASGNFEVQFPAGNSTSAILRFV